MKVPPFVVLMLAFVLGCVGAAFLTGATGPMSLAVPAPLLAVMAFTHRWRLGKGEPLSF